MNDREIEATAAFPDGYGWWAGLMQCRICSHRAGAVVAGSAGEPCPDSLECPECGNMALDPPEGDVD